MSTTDFTHSSTSSTAIWQDERQLFLDVMRERLMAAGRSLDRGMARAAELEGQLRDRLGGRLESLRHKRDSVEAKLALAAQATRSGFRTLRADADEAWSDLRDQWEAVDRDLESLDG